MNSWSVIQVHWSIILLNVVRFWVDYIQIYEYESLREGVAYKKPKINQFSIYLGRSPWIYALDKLLCYDEQKRHSTLNNVWKPEHLSLTTLTKSRGNIQKKWQDLMRFNELSSHKPYLWCSTPSHPQHPKLLSTCCGLVIVYLFMYKMADYISACKCREES